MAGESPVAFTANVAANAGVDFHVLLQCRLGLETLPTKQAKDGHVRTCRAKDTREELMVRAVKHDYISFTTNLSQLGFYFHSFMFLGPLHAMTC